MPLYLAYWVPVLTTVELLVVVVSPVSCEAGECRRIGCRLQRHPIVVEHGNIGAESDRPKQDGHE